MKKQVWYFVIKDRAAHDAHIVDVYMDDIWTSDNQSGWTYQEISGPHGNADGPFSSLEKAKEELDRWLQCDSVKNGTYCYTHNRI